MTAKKNQDIAKTLINTKRTPRLPPTSVAGQKRNSDSMTAASGESSLLNSIEIPEGTPMDSCDSVRRKIRTFIESGAMKVGEFCQEIGVSNRSYNNFLSQNGPTKGCETATYGNAWEFFKKREIAGLKMPKKPKLRDEEGNTKENVSPDLSGINLPGEENDAVEVLATCAEIRRSDGR